MLGDGHGATVVEAQRIVEPTTATLSTGLIEGTLRATCAAVELVGLEVDAGSVAAHVIQEARLCARAAVIAVAAEVFADP